MSYGPLAVPQIGAIQRTIGQVDEAVESFNAALVVRSSGLALAGAGEAYLSQAHARTSEGLYTAAVAALYKGCEMVRRFIPGIGDGVDCVEEELFAMKLLGDLHTYGHKLPPVVFEGTQRRGGHGGEVATARLVRVFYNIVAGATRRCLTAIQPVTFMGHSHSALTCWD